jgi:hypothetical protein
MIRKHWARVGPLEKVFAAYVALWLAGSVVALALLSGGCALTSASYRAQLRAQVAAEFHPAVAYSRLVAFQLAVLDQYLAGGMEVETLAVLSHWTVVGLGVLGGDHPEGWEATARTDWPRVRSELGPYAPLEVWARLFDQLLQ